jgi:molybdenum cofactor cytidylyltransferase
MLALLLAAGRGRRVGGPKALLDLCGVTALERCLRALRAGGADELRVVLGHGAEQARAALPAELASRAHFVINPEPDRGQTSSIRVGLAAGAGAGSCFALHTVDHPLLEAADLSALLEAFDRRARGQSIVVPVVGGRRGHPALFESALAEEFLALGDDEPGHRVVRRDPARVLEVPAGNAWLVRDIDTPEDLAAARAALSDRPHRSAT